MSLPTPLLPAEPTLFSLTDLAVTRFTGPDRAKYLQGQVTCDVNALLPGQSSLGGHCDPKGKLWSDFHLLCLEESLLMLTKPSVLARQLPELKKFAVFAKVEIGEFQGEVVGLAGQGTDAWISAQYGLRETGLVDGGMAVRVEADRWLLASESPLALKLPVGDEALWWGLEIKAGLPHLEAVHQGEYIPQMLNLQALEGISFTKGCYMGQETVARAKYRGANNRALFVLAGSVGGPVASGDALEIQLGDNWRRSGLVLNAWQQQGQVWLTAVLPKDTEADARFRLKQEEGSSLTLQPLPYPLAD
ncbi:MULTISPECIES: tRNA-modifying protein YgfZ [Aeromonas]|uniref:tRNA-modifying protein YgfZ n=1 Tax=Aeromonas TaxID=642 RepID=UPI00296759B5|nr:MULTISPECIES: tRNA-modifying protein YgfZ [Aeromonas]MEB6607019.1 tRNA-modifying protein YgfZ [Aeromonas sanarellii]WOX49016.1 tRNA-modifying protein YgfZ [Aeromonas sp. XH]